MLKSKDKETTARASEIKGKLKQKKHLKKEDILVLQKESMKKK